MTELLLPLLGAGGGTVVFMASGGMYSAGLRSRPDEIEYRDGDYDGVRAYARTKRMQVVLADAWSSRLRGGEVRVESMHPGWAATPGITDSLPGFGRLMGPLLRDPASGADTAVWLVAARPDAPGAHHFWHDRALRPTTYPFQRAQDPAEVRRVPGLRVRGHRHRDVLVSARPRGRRRRAGRAASLALEPEDPRRAP